MNAGIPSSRKILVTETVHNIQNCIIHTVTTVWGLTVWHVSFLWIRLTNSIQYNNNIWYVINTYIRGRICTRREIASILQVRFGFDQEGWNDLVRYKDWQNNILIHIIHCSRYNWNTKHLFHVYTRKSDGDMCVPTFGWKSIV